MRTLSLEERVNIVRYRMQNAHDTLEEVVVHKGHGFYNTAVNRIIMPAIGRSEGLVP